MFFVAQKAYVEQTVAHAVNDAQQIRRPDKFIVGVREQIALHGQAVVCQQGFRIPRPFPHHEHIDNGTAEAFPRDGGLVVPLQSEGDQSFTQGQEAFLQRPVGGTGLIVYGVVVHDPRF